MKEFNFEKASFNEVLRVVKHEYEILGRASKIRILQDSELDFLSLLPMFEMGIVSDIYVRRGCIKYFLS